MNKKFSVIVSDPAWDFLDSLEMSDVKRGAAANYSLMNNSDIISMDVKSIADPDGCLLALWVPSSLLQIGLDTMKNWGFEHKQTYIWVKTKKENFGEFKKFISKNILKKPQVAYDKFAYTRAISSIIESISNVNLNECLAFFMGRLFRQTHEICLIGTNNTKIYKKLANKSQRSVSCAPNLKHSQKPEDLQDSLDIMFPDPNHLKLEMFARRKRSNWTCIGNEVCDGEDIRESLKKLI